MKGLLFDIKDFALNDGDGIRTTVFLKGCPLHCLWCHNPEGLSAKKEMYLRQNGCMNCGLCRRPCSHPECKDIGRCLHICPNDLVSVVGEEWESEALAERLLKRAALYREMGGGITLSGGEPLLQFEFCLELLQKLTGHVHTAIETSGYAYGEVFRSVASLCDHVYMDIKLADSDEHKKYTGVGNERILDNAKWLMQSGISHTFRTPIIPKITDTSENLSAIAAIIGVSSWEKLPYNTLAGAKYKSVGRKYMLGDKF